MGVTKLKRWATKELTGGGAYALDSIDGNELSDGDTAEVITSSGTYHYYLDATSGLAEDSPKVIAPDTNAGTKRWILELMVATQITLVPVGTPANPSEGSMHYNQAEKKIFVATT